MVGYSLGGGVSWLARKHGLAANSVLAVELVTADGRLVRADRDNEPELFWALRGGGGSFGVVTALEFGLYPIHEVYAGAMFWPLERAGEILHAWREWIETVPEEVTSVGRIIQFPPIPLVPEPFRGRSFVLVEAAYLGSEADGAELFGRCASWRPSWTRSPRSLRRSCTSCTWTPSRRCPYSGDGMLLAELPPEAVDGAPRGGRARIGLSAPLGRGPAPGRRARRALARARGPRDAFDAPSLMFAVGITPTPEAHAAVQAHIRHVQRALAPWDARQGVPELHGAEKQTPGTSTGQRDLPPPPEGQGAV